MKRPKNEKVVAITRPLNRANEAVSIVESHRAEAFVAPTLELELINSESLKSLVEIKNELDWLIFTSPTSIESVFKFYPDFREKFNEDCQIAAIGKKTEEIANEYGLFIDLVPKKYTAEGLLEAFKYNNINNSLIGLPRTLSARDTLPKGLEIMGADVILAESYKSILPQDTLRIEVLIEKILNSGIDAITFTSPLTVKNLFKVASDKQIPKLANKLSANILTVAIGPITNNVLESYNVNAIYPETYTVKDMMELLFENI